MAPSRRRLGLVSLVAVLALVVALLAVPAGALARTGHVSRNGHSTSAAAKKAAAKKTAAKKTAAKVTAKKKATSKTKTVVKKTGAAPAVKSATAVTAPAATASATSANAAASVAQSAPVSSAPATSTGSQSASQPAATSGTQTGTALAAPASSTTNASLSPASIYWGAATGTQFTGDLAPWDMQAVNDFENQDAAGKGMSIVPFYENFEDCSSSPCSPETFPWTPFTNIRSRGSIPMVSWSSQSLQDGLSGAATDAKYTDANVASGAFDSYITQWAQSAKAWGHPFYLRFDWEMNGNWFPWDMNTNGNSAADYVAMWRHVHDIFTKVGATNVSWVWCPNVNQDDTYSDLASLYPGSSYVDWTCMDGYNWGNEYGGPWESFDQVFSGTYNQITQQIAPTKPVMLGEFNSNSDGGSQAGWLSDALARIPVTYPKVKAVLLFDDDPFSIESSKASQTAFATGINNPVYATNSYSNLGGSSLTPVPVPGS